VASESAACERGEEKAEVGNGERVLDGLDGQPVLVVDNPAVRGERATVRTERAVGRAHLVHDVVARLEHVRGWLGEAVDDAGHRLRCS
jgi:hypothetical protein